MDIFLVPVLREHIDGAKTDPPIFQIDRQRQLYCLYVPVPNSEPINVASISKTKLAKYRLKTIPPGNERSGPREKARLGALEDNACQPSGRIGSGVDVDAIGQYLGPLGGGMAVNDDLAEIGRAVQKLVSDPQQIFDALALQRNARTHARVAQEIFAYCDRCLQRC